MTQTAGLDGSAGTDDWRTRFVEQFGGVGDDMGLSRSMTRLLGWLVVCDPAHQSAGQIQEALGLSAGSVSTGMAALVRAGLVDRLSLRGDRHTYYRIRAGGWQLLLAARLRVLSEIRHVADDALSQAHGHGDDRLRELRDFYAWCEREFTRLVVERR
ncbi:MAG TPA: MarR family transcriptional regulator [Acidimicrobiales bacterium]|nr:MarR family transcriptional regulator [Acidimicrobiales bacterium]